MPNIYDPEEELRPLFDFDTETCLNVQSTMSKMDEFGLDLIIAQNIDNRLVRVYFSQEILCETRKVLIVRFQVVDCFKKKCTSQKYSMMSVSV